MRFVLVTILTASLVACGGSDDARRVVIATATPVPAATMADPSPTPARPPRSSPTPATSDVAEAAITNAFTVFFDGARTVDEKVAVLENGETYRSMLAGAAANEQFQQLSTVVTAVELVPDADCSAADVGAPCARVEHDLLVEDFPMLADHIGWAIQRNGTWLVAAATWCDVVATGGASC